MITQEALKVIIHEDEAFRELLKVEDPDSVLQQLSSLHLTITTQIAKFGDERPDWYRRANSFVTVLKHRIDETKIARNGHIEDWKTLAQFATQKLYEEGFGDETQPDMDNPRDIQNWIATIS